MPSHVSQLTIPIDLAYIRPVVAYVRELALYAGFDREETGQICLAVEESMNNVVRFGYGQSSDEVFDIIFEPQAAALIIRINEKGMPFSSQRLPDYEPQFPEQDITGAGLGLHLIKSCMNETAFIRKGRKGQEIRLTKYFGGKRINKLFPEVEKQGCYKRHEGVADAEKTSAQDYTIRKMHPEEAVEVSKCAYSCYGYTYEDYVYYPDQLAAMNEDGLLYSVVAVKKDGTVMGHAALKFASPDALTAESGVAFVYPEYRRSGLFGKFNRYFLAYASNRNLKGLYGQSVTSHIATQRMSASTGFQDSGLLLGVCHDEVNFKKISGKIRQRESLVLSYYSLNDQETRTVYLPEHHRDMASHIFEAIKVSVRISGDFPGEDYSTPEYCDMEVARNHGLNLAVISLYHYGNNALDEVRAHLNNLCLERSDVIQLILNVEDPFIGAMVPGLEALGFFFAGFLPYGCADNHAFIMQYLNNVSIDISRINLLSATAGMMMDYIKDKIGRSSQ